jgi:hypothetical protein
MQQDGGMRRPGIDTLLADIWVPVAGRGTPTADERLARARARARARAANAPGRYADTPATTLATHEAIAPAHSSCEPEQALRELDLTAVLVLDTPHAAAFLLRLTDGRSLETEGALVFACLLHLTGRNDAARFWWRLAAGAGSHVAAYCLCLHHRRYGEYRDADYWREQAARLRADHRPDPAREPAPQQPLLPEDVRRELFAQCHKGERPRLPRALEAAVDRLVVDGDDADFGEIPQPSGRLVSDLTRQP